MAIGDQWVGGGDEEGRVDNDAKICNTEDTLYQGESEDGEPTWEVVGITLVLDVLS